MRIILAYWYGGSGRIEKSVDELGPYLMELTKNYDVMLHQDDRQTTIDLVIYLDDKGRRFQKR